MNASGAFNSIHRETEDLSNIKKSYQRVDKAGLKESKEALNMAAQEQALSTRSIEAVV